PDFLEVARQAAVPRLKYRNVASGHGPTSFLARWCSPRCCSGPMLSEPYYRVDFAIAKETVLSLNGEFSKQFYQIRQIRWPFRLKLEGFACPGVLAPEQPCVEGLSAQASNGCPERLRQGLRLGEEMGSVGGVSDHG